MTTKIPSQLIDPTGSTSGQVLQSTGPSAPPGFAALSVANVAGAAPLANPNFSGTVSVPNQAAGTNSTAAASTAFVQGTLAAYAPIANPTFTGTVAVPNQAGGTNTTAAASTAFVQGTLASPPAIGSATPGAGSFTTLGASGLISPTSTVGIKGTTAADNAPAGSWGERPTPTNLSTVPLTTLTATNAASVVLSPGDWSVQCTAQFLAAGSTVPSIYTTGISTTSATRGTFANESLITATFPAGANQQIASPVVRVLTASPLTVYGVVFASFSTSTMSVSGSITAWRNR